MRGGKGNIEGAVAVARAALDNKVARSETLFNLCKVFLAAGAPRLALAALNALPAPTQPCFKRRIPKPDTGGQAEEDKPFETTQLSGAALQVLNVLITMAKQLGEKQLQTIWRQVLVPATPEECAAPASLSAFEEREGTIHPRACAPWLARIFALWQQQRQLLTPFQSGPGENVVRRRDNQWMELGCLAQQHCQYDMAASCFLVCFKSPKHGLAARLRLLSCRLKVRMLSFLSSYSTFSIFGLFWVMLCPCEGRVCFFRFFTCICSFDCRIKK